MGDPGGSRDAAALEPAGVFERDGPCRQCVEMLLHLRDDRAPGARLDLDRFVDRGQRA
jgi:hypothetical protein